MASWFGSPRTAAGCSGPTRACTEGPVTNDDETAGPRPPGDLNPRRDPPLDFPDRDFGDMSDEDYRVLGFLGGLEVHQQLLTRGKLFCRCPAGHRVRNVDAEVLRHMRPTLSEMGEYDGCALMEFKTRKEIVYLLERDTVCTYEIDDTPPFEIDPDAVRVAIEIALLFRLNVVSELHVMRKQYLDGSIPTGFQRTAMVGLDGAIPFRVPELGVNRELRIRQLSLEEDSCREVSDLAHRIVFRTDRLGTPLSETVTEPDLFTPWEVQAGGRLIARVARATGKIRRGAGAARQDVNVSVAGGRRVEIKGVPHHRRLPRLVHVEAFRQLNLLRVADELRRRGFTESLLALPDGGRPWERSTLCVDAAGLLRRCGYAPIREALERGDTVGAIRLPRYAGLLEHRTQPGITFARELSERVRVIACLPSRPFMIHSDVKDYGLDPPDWRQVRAALRADSQDALVVLWGPTDDVATGLREIAARAREAIARGARRDAAGLLRRDHRLRANPPGSGPDVPGHRHASGRGTGHSRAGDPLGSARQTVGSRATTRRVRSRPAAGAKAGILPVGRSVRCGLPTARGERATSRARRSRSASLTCVGRGEPAPRPRSGSGHSSRRSTMGGSGPKRSSAPSMISPSPPIGRWTGFSRPSLRRAPRLRRSRISPAVPQSAPATSPESRARWSCDGPWAR